MKMQKIKPIPKKIMAMIQRQDKKDYPAQDRHLRFYSYMTKNDKELVQVTVAVINHRKKWYCKQVIVHGVHSEKCFLKKNSNVIEEYIFNQASFEFSLKEKIFFIIAAIIKLVLDIIYIFLVLYNHEIFGYFQIYVFSFRF